MKLSKRQRIRQKKLQQKKQKAKKILLIALSSLLILILTFTAIVLILAKKNGRELIDLTFREVITLNIGTADNQPPAEVLQDDNLQAASVVKNAFLIRTTPSESNQSLNYMVYVPEGADKNTPIFIFLHGASDIGETFDQYVEKYQFARSLDYGLWKPDFIMVMPILATGKNWANMSNSVNTILNETIVKYGGNWDNIYIGGASAGANGLTAIARDISFKGVIYMAGYLGEVGNKLSTDSFLSLWAGKEVYYYRDNLFTDGGYGYVPEYVNECIERADDYGITFVQTDLNWNHDVGLVDATFLPESYTDLNGQTCHDAITLLIFGNN